MNARSHWLVLLGSLCAAGSVACGDDTTSGAGTTTGTSAGGGTTGAGGDAATTTTTTTSAGTGGQGGEAAAAVIDSVVPPSGIVTTTITVTGTGFGATQGASKITVDGVAATPATWTDTQIVADVPTSVFPGARPVVVTVDATASNAEPFEVVLPRTVYLNNDDAPNTVSAYAMATSGALTPLSTSPYAMGDDSAGFGGDSSCIAIHRGTRRIFASSNTSVAVFDIDGVTGALTAVSGSPFATGGMGAYGVELNDAGTRLYVANCDSSDISAFDIATTGALVPITGSPFDGTSTGCSDTPQLMANESLLAVTDESSELWVFDVDAVTGALTEITNSPFPAGDTFLSKKDPTGTWLVVPDTVSDALQVFQFDGTTGAPSQIVGSPFSLATTYVHGLAFTPNGARLYVGDYGTSDLFLFDVANGVPTISGTPFTTPGATGMTSMEVTRDGAFLVTTHEDDLAINVFTLATDGAPTAISGSPFAFDVITSEASGLVIGE